MSRVSRAKGAAARRSRPLSSPHHVPCHHLAFTVLVLLHSTLEIQINWIAAWHVYEINKNTPKKMIFFLKKKEKLDRSLALIGSERMRPFLRLLRQREDLIRRCPSGTQWVECPEMSCVSVNACLL